MEGFPGTAINKSSRFALCNQSPDESTSSLAALTLNSSSPDDLGVRLPFASTCGGQSSGLTQSPQPLQLALSFSLRGVRKGHKQENIWEEKMMSLFPKSGLLPASQRYPPEFIAKNSGSLGKILTKGLLPFIKQKPNRSPPILQSKKGSSKQGISL